MTWNECKIFCIYPHDKTTSFLDRIVSYSKNTIGIDFHCYKIKLNESSHKECLRILSILTNQVIVFLGHGRSDTLYGSCGINGEFIICDSFDRDNTEYFNKKFFIYKDNAHVFRKKIIFSLSCNSNETRNSIGRASVESGAKAFIGFGDIYTDYENGRVFSKKEIALFKGCIVKIVKKSIIFSYQQSYSVEQLVDIIKIMTNKEIHHLLTKNKNFRYKHRVANQLYFFKSQIVIFGDRFARLK